FAQVGAVAQVVEQLRGVEQRAQRVRVHLRPCVRGQRQAVVVDREAEGVGCQPAPAQRQQGGQSLVHATPGEGIHEQVPAFARLRELGQQAVRGRQRRDPRLQFQQRRQRAASPATRAGARLNSP